MFAELRLESISFWRTFPQTMIAAVITGMLLGAIASPWLLPPILMFIRFRLFRALNGEEGIEFPNEEV